MAFTPKVYEIAIEKLVHGGQGIGTLPDGKRALVWNVLPGEKVKFETKKSKSSFVEGTATEILTESKDREIPRDELYMSTSPWQIMTIEAENKYKKDILAETLQRGGVVWEKHLDFYAAGSPWNYRNKMEYSFYGDDDGLHLALFNRGTHKKQIVTGSSIAKPEIDRTANAICKVLNENEVRAGDLKSVIIRCNQAGQSVAAIFTKNRDFPELEDLRKACQGVAVYFSNPKSPASVPTQELYIYGNVTLEDELLGQSIAYDVLSFFQVNIEPYSNALELMKNYVSDYQVTDMYAGTGSIGLTIASKDLCLIELDRASATMAEFNAAQYERGEAKVYQVAAEKGLDYIPSGEGQCVIFDPPRAGLHANVVETILEKLPEKIVYLSCNPSTLVRDLDLIQEKYTIEELTGFNFFPKTPHIEALANLKLKSR